MAGVTRRGERSGSPRRTARDRAAVALAWAARGATLLCVAAAPWAFGSVEAWPQLLISATLAAAVFATLIALPFRPPGGSTGGSALPVAAWPLLGFVLLAVLHVVPAGWRDWGLPGHRTLSLDPAATRLRLALLADAVAAVLLGGRLFRTPRHRAVFWWVLAADGAALAFFGLVQKLTWGGALYWAFPLAAGKPFGPFVNRNNAAGWLLVTAAAAVAVAAGTLVRRGGAGGPPGRRTGFAAALHRGGTAFPVAAVLLGFVAAGLIATGSRGGTLAGVAATLSLTAAVLWRTGRLGGTGAVLAVTAPPAAGVTLAAWLGLSGEVADRWRRTLGRDLADDSRVRHWSDALAAFREVPWTGVGPGAYEHGYRAASVDPAGRYFQHADSMPVELLLEGGVPGLLLGVAFALPPAWAAWRLLRRGPTAGTAAVVSRPKRRYVRPRGATRRDADAASAPPSDAAAAGPGAVVLLVGCGVQSLFDFAPVIPAVLLALSSAVGVLWAAADFGGGGAVRRLARTPVAVGCVAVPLLAGLAAAGWEQRRASVAEAAVRAIPPVDARRLGEAGELPTPAAVDAARGRVDAAVAVRPDDVRLRRAAAEFETDAVRLGLYREARAEPGFARVPDGELWDRTAPRALLAAVIAADGGGAALPPAVRGGLRRAADHLSAARTACPSSSAVELEYAAVAHARLPDDTPRAEVAADAVAHAARAAELAPADAAVQIEAGWIAWAAGERDAAFALWRRSLRDDRRYERAVLDGLEGELRFADRVERLLPPDPDRLLSLAEGFYRADPPRRAFLVDRAEALLDDVPPGERDWLRARILALRGDVDGAVAVGTDWVRAGPEPVERRLRFAAALLGWDRPDDAAWAAREAAALDPEDDRAAGLLRRAERAIPAGPRPGSRP